MCGIFGVINCGSDPERLIQAAKTQAHRGPDASGHYLRNGIFLAHQRLSILDLNSRSDQPFAKGGLVIVFNGEIYNFREIRQELKRHCDFITDSDTEVVLEAWRKWGPDSLQKLRGMFAFSIHDEASGQTWLVRDPFGIKPLFYYPLSGAGVAFASELKTLEAAFRPQFSLNLEAMTASLLYAFIPENLCIWNEVKKLPPGYCLKIDANHQISSYPFYHPDQLVAPEQPSITSEIEAVASLEQVLLESVKSHLVADVPVSAFLSGGLDSSLLVAMARSELETLDCYTIEFSEQARKAEAMTDDAHYAKQVAKHLKVNLDTIQVEPDLASLLPIIVHHLDEPIGDSAAISTLLICESAREQGVKVLLSGMGADELFGGYRKHAATLIAQRYKQIPALLRAPVKPLLDMLPVSVAGRGLIPVRWAKRFLGFAELPVADSFFRSYTYYDRDTLADLSPNSERHFDSILKNHHDIFNTDHHRPLLDRMCYTDMQLFMVSLNQTYTDRASMAASTEVRVPFIDKKVVELSFRIASELKIKGNQSKYVLKKVAEKWLPREIVYRPKSSFTLPLRSWMSTQLTDMVDDYVLSDNGLAGRPWFNKQALTDMVERDRKGRNDNAQPIWHLLTLEQWFRNHDL
ncbi:MAG TPA: asparagine synthase (glutamine-hydrolyzing) [Gammaproteobacteria bacterium]|nr:asparagine synthase (glutamine-hydrolyzing) [Gammaproteobacteria bacterium]HIL95988.1 asparagine synthase (glutamine-hydrolyzing) [Pseudomonadales bacterium]